MQPMTESEMKNHINSKSWICVDTKHFGSNEYKSHIGLLRVMFGISEDPKCINTLLSDDSTEVWAKFDSDWENLFVC